MDKNPKKRTLWNARKLTKKSREIISRYQIKIFHQIIPLSFIVDCPSPNGIFADTTDNTCKRYYICANGGPVEYNCGPGTVFDPNLQVCNYESNYQCGDGTTEHQTSPQTPTGYLEIF